MHNKEDAIAIVATQRTPIGQFLGSLASLSAPQLTRFAIQKTLTQISLNPDDINEVIIGCVLTAGIGQAPARQAAILGTLPAHVGCTTINKMCGSGMKALMLAHDLLKAGSAQIILAGGMESMSNAPYLSLKARTGYRMGHQTVYDHMFLDGLEDAYDKGKLMGCFAEECAKKYHFSRQTQDEFALNSLERSQKAIQNGLFKAEIATITLTDKLGTTVVENDELPLKAKPEKIPTLKPAFSAQGTVTAANSSAISDGSAVHILMPMQEAKKRNLIPLATIIAHATHAQAPAWFTTAPVQAIQKVLKKANWTVEDVDLFEINEAFAVVTLTAIEELKLNPEKVNIHGGACALGHPIGASGARIVTTLIYALKEKRLKRGIAALCIGGGEATAMAIEVK